MSPAQEESSFGRRLRRLREDAGLTQEELAMRAGLTSNAVSGLAQGKTRRPYPHTVRSLADALGLSEDEQASLLAVVPRQRDASARETLSPVSGPTLPNPPTPLLGREWEIREIQDLLSDSEVRLLTLTGIGGVGKTRLALKAAREAEGHFPDGVAFVDLAPLRDPALMVSTVARSLGLREVEGQSAADTLRTHLLEKQTLLVLDNFEHLLEAAAEVVHLIEACPGLVVLATSRASLRVRALALSSSSLPSGPECGSDRYLPRGLLAPATSPTDSAQKWRSGAEQKPEVVPVTAFCLVVEGELLPATKHVDDKDDPGRKPVPESPQ